MSDVLIHAGKATLFRKSSGLTQDELGLALGKSRRLIQRIEGDKDVRTTCRVNHEYAEALGVHPAMLWRSLPEDFTYFGRVIKSGERLARLITSKRISDFIILGAPDDQTRTKDLIQLAEIFDEHQDEYNREKTAVPTGRAKRTVEELIKIKVLFEALTKDPPVTEQLKIRHIMTYGLSAYDEKGQRTRTFMHSSTNHIIIDHADDRNGGSNYSITRAVIPWLTTRRDSDERRMVFRAEVPETQEQRFLANLGEFFNRINSSGQKDGFLEAKGTPIIDNE